MSSERVTQRRRKRQRVPSLDLGVEGCRDDHGGPRSGAESCDFLSLHKHYSISWHVSVTDKSLEWRLQQTCGQQLRAPRWSVTQQMEDTDRLTPQDRIEIWGSLTMSNVLPGIGPSLTDGGRCDPGICGRPPEWTNWNGQNI